MGRNAGRHCTLCCVCTWCSTVCPARRSAARLVPKQRCPLFAWRSPAYRVPAAAHGSAINCVGGAHCAWGAGGLGTVTDPDPVALAQVAVVEVLRAVCCASAKCLQAGQADAYWGPAWNRSKDSASLCAVSRAAIMLRRPKAASCKPVTAGPTALCWGTCTYQQLPSGVDACHSCNRRHDKHCV